MTRKSTYTTYISLYARVCTFAFYTVGTVKIESFNFKIKKIEKNISNND